MKVSSAIVQIIAICVAGIIFYPLVSKWWDVHMIKTKYEELPVEERNLVKAIDELKECKQEKLDITQAYKDTINEINKQHKIELHKLEEKQDEEKEGAMEMLTKAYQQKVDTVSQIIAKKVTTLSDKIKEYDSKKDSLSTVVSNLEKSNNNLRFKLKQSYERIITLYRDSIKHAREVPSD